MKIPGGAQLLMKMEKFKNQDLLDTLPKRVVGFAVMDTIEELAIQIKTLKK